MSSSFSERHGFNRVYETEITVREDAPYDLRGVIVELAYKCGFSPKSLRILVCSVLLKRPDENNWSEFPNIDYEVRELIDGCIWYKVYDIIEQICIKMSEAPYSYELESFERKLTEYFIENGIGWKLIDGKIEVRGPESFERIVSDSYEILGDHTHNTASKELHEALADLSRRPEPDVTGAIQHSMAALECVAREVCGNKKATLGEIMKRHKELMPAPIDEAVIKLWGYASENARHIREGREPDFSEAELIVGVCASVSAYLANKSKV